MTLAKIKEEFLRGRVDGHPVSLRELAERHGRTHASLRMAASRGGWSALAAVACAERDCAVAEKIADRGAVVNALLAETIETHVQVRERHARLARSLQQVALERLLTLGAGELSAKLAVELLRTGLDAERAALRLDEPATQPQGLDPSHHAFREALETAQAILERHATASESPTLVGS